MLPSRVLCLSAFLVGVLGVAPKAGTAQQARQPGTIVFSQWKCPSQNVSAFTAAFDSSLAPILNEMMAEGRLLGWGVWTHSWGDEWNWNLYYATENHRAFLDFWAEYLRRVTARLPSYFDRVTPLCTEHRDNIYAVHADRRRP